MDETSRKHLRIGVRWGLWSLLFEKAQRVKTILGSSKMVFTLSEKITDHRTGYENKVDSQRVKESSIILKKTLF